MAAVLLLFLLSVMPVWGWLDMRRLKRLDSAAARSRSYLLTITALWLLAALATLLLPASLWTPPASLVAAVQLGHAPPGALIGIVTGLMVGLLMPVLMARSKPALIERQLAPIRFLLPTASAQRWLFVLLSLTAGITEEWIYRGFVLHDLTARWPGSSGWLVMAAAALLFGIAHAYQGWRGMTITAVLGWFFCVLYVATGSLLAPMILHALIDLRILLLLPRARPATAA